MKPILKMILVFGCLAFAMLCVGCEDETPVETGDLEITFSSIDTTKYYAFEWVNQDTPETTNFNSGADGGTPPDTRPTGIRISENSNIFKIEVVNLGTYKLTIYKSNSQLAQPFTSSDYDTKKEQNVIIGEGTNKISVAF